MNGSCAFPTSYLYIQQAEKETIVSHRARSGKVPLFTDLELAFHQQTLRSMLV